MSRIAVLGAGALGTAMAIALQKRDRTLSLWTIEADVAESLRRTHENAKYLPGFKISPSVHVTLDCGEAIEDADVVLITVPSHAVRDVARAIAALIPERAVLVCADKGLEEGSWKRMSQVLREEIPADVPVPIVALSGPCLAPEMARGGVSAVDVACEDPAAARRARSLLATPRFRMRPMTDVAGVEAGGTFKNAYAVGAGIGDGLGWGMNERAAYLTKALAEIARLASSLGARRSTLYGLSGLGDLAVTSMSPHSRNRRLGEELSRGRELKEILSATVNVTEGVAATRAASAIAARHRLRLPIAASLHAILHDGAAPKSLERALKSSR
ncbi:MAG: NAD(P)-dependent glycerol-3-phosphate dehydrogenase [Acidobacteria bacterium]|nr:NAD(P)-dependent glycerol-3-phosphate dehydrogenase [Acidobacteriota bacterium]